MPPYYESALFTQADRSARVTNALERLMDAADQLSVRIVRDAPGLTDHGIRHLDAIWHTASTIAGPGWRLSDAELFVFGAAVAVHDLAMTAATYDGGLDELKATTRFTDELALAKKGLDEDSADTDAERFAVFAVLRAEHGDRAQKLLTRTVGDGDGVSLIEDSDLRSEFGWLAGRIAASHSWSLAETEIQFRGGVRASSTFDGQSVDPLVLACLLRAADACQIDRRRASAAGKAAERPTGVSVAHWEFQTRTAPAHLELNRLDVASTSPFPVALRDAWWLAYDTWTMADRELVAVDAVLSDAAPSRRLAARSVRGVSSARAFARHFEADGWQPVDTQVRVSRIQSLVESLGGYNLYGTTPNVPLRELLQNAIDACRARRDLSNGSPDTRVVIRLVGESEAWALEVEDWGVGMSERVLLAALLDFGSSLWNSPELASELPGLASSPFSAGGRFGIGFFSVFMWADSVTVWTRRHADAPNQTRILEFSGVGGRPLLRLPRQSEQLEHCGTKVRLELNEAGRKAFGIAQEEVKIHRFIRRHKGGLDAIVAELAPMSEIDLYCADGSSANGEGSESLAVSGGDWKTISPSSLGARVSRMELNEREKSWLDVFCDEVHDHDGTVLGRVAQRPSSTYDHGVVCSEGVITGRLHLRTGVLAGAPSNAARTHGSVARTVDWERWVAGQVTRLEQVAKAEEDWATPSALAEVAWDLVDLERSFPEVPMWRRSDRWISTSNLREWLTERPVGATVTLADPNEVQGDTPVDHSTVSDHVVFTPSGERLYLQDDWNDGDSFAISAFRLLLKESWELTDDLPVVEVSGVRLGTTTEGFDAVFTDVYEFVRPR